MKFENHLFYNCKITTDTGETYQVFSNWLHNERLDYWEGYECAAGHTRLFIDKDLDVYSGECRNDYLGNTLTGFEISPTLTLCKQQRCTGCTDDLSIEKRKR